MRTSPSPIASRARRRGRPSSRTCRSSSSEFVLDEPDRVCPSCGGGLSPMKGQYDESEMIDVVEISYRAREGEAAEVRVPLRQLRRDRARTRAGAAGQPLLARLRDQGDPRQVARSHPARAPGPHPRATRARGDIADALGSGVRRRPAALARRCRTDEARARATGDRPRSNELAAARDRCDEAVADVGADRAGRRRPSDPRRQERGDLRRARR